MRPFGVFFSPDIDPAGSGAAATDADRDADSLDQSRRDGDDRDTDTETDANPVASAGRAFLEGLSDDERDRPFAGGEDDDTDEEELERQRVAAAGAADDEDEDDAGDDEPITRDDDGATWKKVGGSWRWVLDGKFVDGEAPEGWVAPKEKPAAAAKDGKDAKVADGKDQAGKKKDPEPKVAKVTLAGESDRGEEDIEVEVDEELAERIRRLQKGSMRRATFEKRQADVTARAAEMAEVEHWLDEDPVGFLISQVDEKRRLEVARALVITHLPELKADIEAMLDDEVARLTQKDKLRDGMDASAKRLEASRRNRAYAAQVMSSVEKLVPEDVDDDVRDEFMKDARRILSDLASNGTKVTPDSVKAQLERRVKLYGFDKTRRPVTAPRREASRRGEPDASGTRVARPATDAARKVAEQRTPTRAEASAAQSRIRRVQQSRTASSRQAPPGAGAAPTQVPMLKPEEETDVRTASRALRKRGVSDSWTSAQSK